MFVVRCSNYFSLFQIKVVILPIRMNLQKADGNRFDYFVFFYPRAVYCDRPTQLYLKGRGRGNKIVVEHFPEASA